MGFTHNYCYIASLTKQERQRKPCIANLVYGTIHFRCDMITLVLSFHWRRSPLYQSTCLTPVKCLHLQGKTNKEYIS